MFILLNFSPFGELKSSKIAPRPKALQLNRYVYYTLTIIMPKRDSRNEIANPSNKSNWKFESQTNLTPQNRQDNFYYAPHSSNMMYKQHLNSHHSQQNIKNRLKMEKIYKKRSSQTTILDHSLTVKVKTAIAQQRKINNIQIKINAQKHRETTEKSTFLKYFTTQPKTPIAQRDRQPPTNSSKILKPTQHANMTPQRHTKIRQKK